MSREKVIKMRRREKDEVDREIVPIAMKVVSLRMDVVLSLSLL
jgi:hypothetical protein